MNLRLEHVFALNHPVRSTKELAAEYWDFSRAGWSLVTVVLLDKTPFENFPAWHVMVAKTLRGKNLAIEHWGDGTMRFAAKQAGDRLSGVGRGEIVVHPGAVCIHVLKSLLPAEASLAVRALTRNAILSPQEAEFASKLEALCRK